MLLALLANLQGCAGLAALPQPLDSENANWIATARNSVCLRAERIDQHSRVERELVRACERGVRIKMVLYFDGQKESANLRSTCATIYLSDNPNLLGRHSVYIIDGDSIVEYGRLTAVANQKSYQEFLFWKALAASAVRYH
jgi:hypothetical protein